MAQMLLMACITSNLFADEYPRIQFLMHSNSSEASSVVEVLGSGKGSGVLVVMDGKPVIITNSHNLQGKSSAMVTLPRRKAQYFKHDPEIEMRDEYLSFEGIAKVLYDFPLSDVTVLTVPEGLSRDQMNIINAYALENGVLSAKKGWEANKYSMGNGDVIAAVLNGKSTSIEGLDGFTAGTTPDLFISGDGNPILIIPIFAKPGVSGGGYYKNGVLQGLVTKISLAGEPIALATPFTKIAKLIYSPDKVEKKVAWDNGLMVYQAEDRTVSANPLASGWLGNGGELVEIDESASGDTNPNYWRLQVNSWGYNKIITTWDPFVYRPGQFKINQQNVSFIKVKSKSFFKTVERFQIPTLASFVASEKKGDQQTLLSNTPQNIQMLKEARLQKKPNINFGRLYKNNYADKYFQIFNIRINNHNGAQPLIPASKDRWAAAPKYNRWFAPEPIIIMDGKVHVDPDGYFFNMPFSTKISDSTIFDLKINGSHLNLPGNAFLKGAADLSQVSVRVSDGEEIILKSTQANSPNSLVFKSEDGAFRAIYIYSNDDLTNLARIYIESESALIELWAM